MQGDLYGTLARARLLCRSLMSFASCALICASFINWTDFPSLAQNWNLYGTRNHQNGTQNAYPVALRCPDFGGTVPKSVGLKTLSGRPTTSDIQIQTSAISRGIGLYELVKIRKREDDSNSSLCADGDPSRPVLFDV